MKLIVQLRANLEYEVPVIRDIWNELALLPSTLLDLIEPAHFLEMDVRVNEPKKESIQALESF